MKFLRKETESFSKWKDLMMEKDFNKIPEDTSNIPLKRLKRVKGFNDNNQLSEDIFPIEFFYRKMNEYEIKTKRKTESLTRTF